MKYFENLPTVTYSTNYSVKNIFKRFKFVDAIDNEDIINVRMLNNETLHSLSYKYYGDETFWWVLALMNDIKDIFFEIPLSNDFLNKMSVELTRQKINLTNVKLLTVDTDVTGNNSSRTGIIKVINPVENYVYIDLSGDYLPLTPSDTYLITSFGNYTISSSISSTAFSTSVSDKYDELDTFNDTNRIIKIFKPELKNKILSQIEETLND